MDRVPLEQEQEELLAIMVEASRAVPREQRQAFLVIQSMDGNHLLHPGVAATGRAQYQPHLGDLETLHERGLIRLTLVSPHHTYTADLRLEGTHYYEQMQARRGQPITRAVTVARDYLETESFRRRHEAAVAKWVEAERLQWSADSQQAATTIGHLCREAMQLFASDLVQAAGVTADANAQNTVNRVRLVLGTRLPAGGRRALADALIGYWGTVADLTQRQEHGAQRDQAPLTWEDSRRVVTQTLMVMYELDRELQTPAAG
jgi:hypothetical protein